MPIRYEIAEDIQEQVNEIANILFPHVRIDSCICLRSFGSSSRGTIARCHALGKAMQLAMGRKKGFYVIEVISKRFDKMKPVDRTKTLIHELMHIPKSFGGGFRHHDYVCEENIEAQYQRYINYKKKFGVSDKETRRKEEDSENFSNNNFINDSEDKIMSNNEFNLNDWL